MADHLPPPPVPADADLRGMDFMPLKGDRLFNSETWIEASNEGRVAALRQWWHAFSKEVPAGSLPDNDRLLAVYAGYGEAALKAWRKVRPEATKGWFKCSDGRLYHKFLAELVCEAWDKRLDYRGERDAKAERQRRWRERLKRLAGLLRTKGITVPRGAKMETLEKLCRDADVDVSETESDADVDVDRDGGEIGKTGTGTGKRQGQGEGKVVKDEAEASSGAAPADDPPVSQAAMAQRTLVDEAHSLWVAFASQNGVPDNAFLNSVTRPLLADRLTECSGIDGWKLALERAQEAKFLRDGDRWQWWFDLDWILKPNNFSRLIGGRYAERHRKNGTGDRDERSVMAGVTALAKESSG
jgi:hypothetical protein